MNTSLKVGMIIAGIISNSILTNKGCAANSKTPNNYPKSVLSMYEEDDLGSFALFGGGFINYGYWKKPLVKEISLEERIESQKDLYRFVCEKIEIAQTDFVLEVGSGLGFGAALMISEYQPATIKGVDFSNSQVEKARSAHRELISQGKISFEVSRAEFLNFADNSFDKVISIEAAQHFESIDSFIQQSYRVLKPSGSLAIATFFGTSEDSYFRAKDMIDTVRTGIDHLTPISQIKKILEEANFINIRIESIGQNVWPGYCKWISQQEEFKDSWGANWIKCYSGNVVDYYLILAEKPNGQ